MSEEVLSHADLMRRATRKALDLAAKIAATNARSEKDYSERLRLKTERKIDRRLPRIFYWSWSQTIRLEANAGHSNVQIHVCSGFGDCEKPEMYEDMLWKKGADFLRQKGYKVTLERKYKLSKVNAWGAQEGDYTEFYLDVSWEE